jgi:hypothetical protein
MPWVGFETTIPEFELAKIVRALDNAATVTGSRAIMQRLSRKRVFVQLVRKWLAFCAILMFTTVASPSAPYPEPVASSKLHSDTIIVFLDITHRPVCVTVCSVADDIVLHPSCLNPRRLDEHTSVNNVYLSLMDCCWVTVVADRNDSCEIVAVVTRLGTSHMP